MQIKNVSVYHGSPLPTDHVGPPVLAHEPEEEGGRPAQEVRQIRVELESLVAIVKLIPL